MAKLLDIIAFLSIITSAAAALLTLCTTTYLDLQISNNVFFFVFFGTLFIYNLDHTLSLKSDRLTNPIRSNFINKYINYFYILIFSSLIISVTLALQIGVNKLIYIFPAFILGLFHRKLKKNSLIAAIYITTCWLLVTTFFPAFISDELLEIYPLFLIFGFPLFSNALTSSSKDNPNSYKYLQISKFIAVLGILINIIFWEKTFQLIAIPTLTLISLITFKNDERYEIIYLDGSLLIGATISLFFLIFLSI